VQDEDIAFGFTAYNPVLVEEEEIYRALEMSLLVCGLPGGRRVVDALPIFRVKCHRAAVKERYGCRFRV
jgi:hypothetical protein